MARISNISGFPEWLPEEKLAEDKVIARIKALYELAGYVPIETPAVEHISTLCAKGVIDKEIYALRRAQASEDKEEELALHFDLTVPFARYVALHFNELLFPFKRYQVQKVWRGDRPQKGRFREFYQFDIDVIAREDLPLSCDAEVLSLLDGAFASLQIDPHIVKLNNRKLLLGFYESLGLALESRKAAITVVDKIDKIGAQKVREELVLIPGVTEAQAEKIVELTSFKVPGREARERLDTLVVDSAVWSEGKEEVTTLLSLVSEEALNRIVLDLSLARGLDYYTGAVFEVSFPKYPEYGSLGGGGRYEDLASEFINKKLPGVGASMGLTRVMDLLLKNKLVPTTERGKATVLVTVYDEAQRKQSTQIAHTLRSLGVGAEVFYKSPKLGKQLEYAESKGMSYALFVNGDALEVKNLKSKEQQKIADLAEWAKNIYSKSI